jgi:hypothetical protein
MRYADVAWLASDYQPGTDVTGGADQLLSWLAWGASAAGVFGVIICGMQLALQLRRGDPGEQGEYMRGLVYVLIACVVASTAGPIVAFINATGY